MFRYISQRRDQFFFLQLQDPSQNALCLKEKPHDEFMDTGRMNSFTEGWIDYKVDVGEHIYNFSV